MDVPNQEGRLLPGSFGEVHFAVGSNVNKVTVPVNAMLFRSEGPRLAIIGDDKKVQMRQINIGRDYGATLEILGGVSMGDQIVINPPDSLEEGQEVNLAQAAQAPPEGPLSPQQQKPQTPRQRENRPLQQDAKPQGKQQGGRGR